MEIEAAIISRIKADTGIKALIGKRIRPIAAAEFDVRPYVGFYTQIPDEQFDHFSGRAAIRKIEFVFDIWGDTLADCKEVSRAFRDSLDYLAGTTIEDVVICLSKHKGDSDLSEPPDVGMANPIKRISSN